MQSIPEKSKMSKIVQIDNIVEELKEDLEDVLLSLLLLLFAFTKSIKIVIYYKIIENILTLIIESIWNFSNSKNSIKLELL
jgi:hypothetical protein